MSVSGGLSGALLIRSSRPDRHFLCSLSASDALMMLRGSRHANRALFAKDIEPHRLQDVPQSQIHSEPKNQRSQPRRIKPHDQTRDHAYAQQRWPIPIEGFQVDRRGFVLALLRIADVANQLPIVPAGLIGALQSGFTAGLPRAAVIAEEVPAVRAVVGFRCDVATANRAFGCISQPMNTRRGTGYNAGHRKIPQKLVAQTAVCWTYPQLQGIPREQSSRAFRHLHGSAPIIVRHFDLVPSPSVDAYKMSLETDYRYNQTVSVLKNLKGVVAAISRSWH